MACPRAETEKRSLLRRPDAARWRFGRLRRGFQEAAREVAKSEISISAPDDRQQFDKAGL
jgi:hypothetical protein